jgi:hypothetical protein
MGTQAPTPWPDPSCPFVGRGNSDDWTSAVNDAPWASRTIGGDTDYYKALACPRCSHNMVVFLAAGAYRAANDRGVIATCNCLEAHAGRPDGDKGCGFGAWIGRPVVTQ